MSNPDSTNNYPNTGRTPPEDNTDIQRRVQEAIDKAYAKAAANRASSVNQNRAEPETQSPNRAAQPVYTETGSAAPRQAARSAQPARPAQTSRPAQASRPAQQGRPAQASRPANRVPSGAAGARRPAPKKKSKAVLPVILVLILALAVGGFFAVRSISAKSLTSAMGLSDNKYTVTSAEEMVLYLNHPALMEGDTIAVKDNIVIDIDEEFGSYLSIPLVNFDCSEGGLTFVGGTCYIYGGFDSKASMDGVAFSGTDLYIDAPASSLTWNMSPSDTSKLNLKSLNGSDCLHDLGILVEGSYTTLPVTVTNVSSSALSDAEVTLTGYNFIFPDGNTVNVGNLSAGQSTSVDVRVLCAEGGHGNITATAIDASGHQVVSGSSDYVDILGGGYYAGDTNTHTTDSDIGKTRGQSRWSTLEENVTAAYGRGMSYIISSEDNRRARELDQSAVDLLVGKPGVFIQVPGAGTINSGANISLEFIDYPDGIELPSSVYDVEVDDMLWTAQSAINEAVDNGATVIYTQPTSVGDPMEALYRLESIYNVGAIEVLQQHTVEYPSQRWTVLYRAWDMVNTYGRIKLFGVASSNNVSANDVGTCYTKGYMGTLTRENITEMIHSGNYFMSNGPEIRFNVGGTQMGQTMDVIEGETVLLNVTVSDDVPLTGVAIYKYEITRKIEDPHPILIEVLDLTSLNTTRYSRTIEDVVTEDCYYRVEVQSQSSDYDTAAEGRAYSNPIWVSVEGQSGNTSLNPEAITYDLAHAGGSFLSGLFSKDYTNVSLKEADNGDRYFDATEGKFSLRGISVAEGGTLAPKMSINYHAGAGDNADFVTIRIGAENGNYSIYKLYVVE